MVMHMMKAYRMLGGSGEDEGNYVCREGDIHAFVGRYRRET